MGEVIDECAEALFRIVADTVDPVERAGISLEVVRQIQNRLLPDMANIRRSAVRYARNRMSAQELADRLSMSRARLYAVLAGDEEITGPVTIRYATASGGTAEARVSWVVDRIDEDRLHITRKEIRRRWDDIQKTVIVPTQSLEVDARMANDAFRSLESQAAYALSEADQVAQDEIEGSTNKGPTERLWHFRTEGTSSPRWPNTYYVPGE